MSGEEGKEQANKRGGRGEDTGDRITGQKDESNILIPPGVDFCFLMQTWVLARLAGQQAPGTHLSLSV